MYMYIYNRNTFDYIIQYRFFNLKYKFPYKIQMNSMKKIKIKLNQTLKFSVFIKGLKSQSN